MDVLSATDVSQLLGSRTSPCVSLYMPTHRVGENTKQGRVRLKNLLDMAEQQLTQAGLRVSEAREMLDSARQLLDDSPFWSYQSDGLAIFISRDQSWRFRLPIPFDEVVMTGGRFHLKPLMPLLTGDGLFYILAISQNQVRVLRCTRDFCEEVQSSLIPQSEAVILQYVEQQKQLQWHSQTSPSPKGGKRAAVFHGQGGPQRDHKARLFEYFRIVVTGLRHLISDPHTPVVFAGVEYLYPLFRQANDGLHLLDDFIRGNADESHRVLATDLRKQAWRIVEPHFLAERRKAAELVRNAAATAPHRAARTLDDAVRAAHDGRIEYLFVDRSEHRWGRLDPATGKVQVHDRPQNGDEDLLDFAATSTLAHRGTVYAVDHDEMPEDAPIAALLRY